MFKFIIRILRQKVTGRFALVTLFVFLGYLSISQPYNFSYTYQNVTRANGGGTLETGDTIEVRALMKVNNKATNVYYIDTIPLGLRYVPNSMKIVTNEGLLFDGTYTDATNDDKGVYIGGAFARLRINIGSGAANARNGAPFSSTSGGGTVNPGDKPKFYGKTLFVVAYRLVVTAAFGDTIYPTGKFFYKDYNGKNQVERFNYAGIRVMPNQDLCKDFSGASFSAESSFGNGNIQNRPAGATVPGYTRKNLSPNNPVDGEYAIANNTSGNGSTNNGVPYPTTNDRVFGVWDIVGDHTGAAIPALGNPPTKPGNTGGYMLVVNSAYPTGEAYSDLIKNVCPNTYYEFSAWIRNICGYCGIDSNDKSTNKPGVLPNLAYTINDVDYYNTGTLPWNKNWEKRGFIYKTGIAETSFKITVKNNAAGGGGNDWVLDDINLTTCYPNLTMNPTDTAKVCAGAIINLYDTIRSYFDNYSYYCWEKSIDGGLTWIGTGNCGSKTPILKNGLYEYIVDTSFMSVVADSGTFYRVKVATTFANLTNINCAVNNSQKVFMKVYNYDCSILRSVLKDFSGRMENGFALLNWSTLDETGVKNFEIQKSTDGYSFTTFQVISSLHEAGGSYQIRDIDQISGNLFYRIKINGQYENQVKFSNVINLYQLDNSFDFKVVNPFTNNLKIELKSPAAGVWESLLYDEYGRIIRRKAFKVLRGNNTLFIDDVSSLQPGVYILTGSMNGHTVQQKVVKVH